MKSKRNFNLNFFILCMVLIILPGCRLGCHSSSGPELLSNYEAKFSSIGDFSTVPNGSYIYLSETKSEWGKITLGINANKLEDVSAIYFDLVYNPAVINYMEKKEGTFFNSDGKSTSGFNVALENKTDGRLYVSINRLNNSSVRGDGLIGEISFIPISADTTFINFENNKLFRYNADTFESTEVRVIWFGGIIVSKKI